MDKSDSQYQTFSQLAIDALVAGTDYFGECIVGVNADLTWNPKQGYFDKTVFLREGDGLKHKSTSGIGFYLNSDKTKLDVCSGHMVFRNVPVTPALARELETAITNPYG